MRRTGGARIIGVWLEPQKAVAQLESRIKVFEKPLASKERVRHREFAKPYQGGPGQNGRSVITIKLEMKFAIGSRKRASSPLQGRKRMSVLIFE
jgi:hypothetical protein